MNMDSVNKWLTLAANLGVILGIVFLSLELNQANRLAERDVRREQTNSTYNIAASIWENPELAALMVKLESYETDLTDEERLRVLNFSQMQLNLAVSMNINYENGFLSEDILGRTTQAQKQQIMGMPGLVPYLKQSIERQGFSSLFTGNSPLAFQGIIEGMRFVEEKVGMDQF